MNDQQRIIDATNKLVLEGGIRQIIMCVELDDGTCWFNHCKKKEASLAPFTAERINLLFSKGVAP